jgi:hypothetical protein
MKTVFLARSHDQDAKRRSERGVTIVLVALAMVAIISMAALSIDIVTLYLARGEAQRSADAGALAAARIISMSGATGDPANTSGSLSGLPWGLACNLAKQVATAVAQQTTVGGTAPITVNFKFTYNGSDTATCSSVAGAFTVNPQVQVQVQQTGLPTFFSRIWGRTGNTVSATSTAEVLNPSNSDAYAGNVVPVQPRCVKPWVVPNLDPMNAVNCVGNACQTFVSLVDGTITHPGISTGGASTNGVIGETFNLFPDCRFGGICTLRDTPPTTNRTVSGVIPAQPNLEYLPGEVAAASTAVPSGPSGACGDVASDYSQAIAGCDQTTVYHCGVQNANSVNLNENPRSNGAGQAAQCLVHQDSSGIGTISGQDTLDTTTTFPFRINAGTANPLGLSGSTITSSNSIVSLPIFDNLNNPIAASGGSSVTVVGFLQVFINSADDNGNVNVTVLNVSGCGKNVASGTVAIKGTSSVPVRLITPQ